MKLQDIHDIARSRGIKPEKMYKIELIRSIQIAEGNFDCFARAKDGKCDQLGCRWREDCFATAASQ
ncbi:MAG: SAP domain-containing protein [Sideroxydans sp.]|nr:SAP domain-containing protein [Sideroxydans sp.]